ncbi:hypothetical protein LINPERHAP1_LOCUS36753 [Linum perenne]
MGRAVFFSAGSMRGTGDIGGFTLLVELWALERFPRIAERYIHGGVPPVDDTVPRGARWLPIIGYAPDRHYQWSEYPAQFTGQEGASSSQPPGFTSQPPGFTSQPSFHSQHYDRSSQQICPPPPPPSPPTPPPGHRYASADMACTSDRTIPAVEQTGVLRG